jgi:hypothetical protein
MRSGRSADVVLADRLCGVSAASLGGFVGYPPAVGKLGRKQLDALVKEATVDCCDEHEQLSGLYTMIVDNLAMPFQTTVLGVEVTVEDIDLTDYGAIVAYCQRGKYRQAIGVLDLPLPKPPPEGSEWIEAYRTGRVEVASSSRDEQWVLAAKRHRLSAERVRMARALGLNPAKLGKLDNHRQEPWKAPLPQFIEDLYAKRFGRARQGDADE